MTDDDMIDSEEGTYMPAVTVRQLRDLLADLPEQDARIIIWTGEGAVVPRVLVTGDRRTLVAELDAENEVYGMHATESYNPMACEGCGDAIPAGEYGLYLDAAGHWTAIAPRPDNEMFNSGLLCLSCMDTRLQERVGVTLAESLAEDHHLVRHAPATDALVDILPLDFIDAYEDDASRHTREGLVDWKWLSDEQYTRFTKRVEVEDTSGDGNDDA